MITLPEGQNRHRTTVTSQRGTAPDPGSVRRAHLCRYVRGRGAQLVTFESPSVRLFVAGLGDEVARGVGSQWVLDGEESPFVGDALERMGAAIDEWDARAADKVGDRARDEDFVGLGESLDALGGVDGDGAQAIAVSATR